MVTIKQFDVLIIGAGPAGLSCAMRLINSGLTVAILEKSAFPRDKICGDALSLDVINQLSLLSENLKSSFEKFPNKIPSGGVRIFAPDENFIDIPFIQNSIEKYGYLCKRFDFDNLLYSETKQMNHVSIIENCTVKNVSKCDNGVNIETSRGRFVGTMLIGADGAHSVVSRRIGGIRVDPQHYCSGIRQYFENVSQVHEKNYIELYFLKDFLPGYLWIFPLPENKANVGIGILSSVISKKKINLKKILSFYISENPLLQERLKNAVPAEEPKGYGLPLGSKKRIISGDNYLLLGDAAGLIDPFTGEGVANAIRSGRIAADHLKDCFSKNNFSAIFNKSYDKEVYRRMGNEFTLSITLQKFSKYPGLFNFVVKRANQSKKVRQFLIEGMANVDKKAEFIKQILKYNTRLKSK